MLLHQTRNLTMRKAQVFLNKRTMKNNRTLFFVVAFTALAFVPGRSSVSGCSTVSNTQSQVATPDDIVHIILDDAKPEKASQCWKIMKCTRLQYLSPYLSPQIVFSLQEWIIARDKLGSSPEGAYDPLTYRMWQPQKVCVGKAKYSGSVSTLLSP